MLKNANHPTIYLKDYQAPQFNLHSCKLNFTLDPKQSKVRAEYDIEFSDEIKKRALSFDGEAISLISIKIDGKALSKAQYQLDKKSLSLADLPPRFSLVINSHCDPSSNTALSGLYQSGDMLCTQCEAQGFRRICYGFDRPDVLSIYTVKIIANKNHYPVLLSNGNLIEQGDIPSSNQHYAIWQDPFPKPCYLFALVAGDLQRHSDTFTTRSGKTIDLHVLTRSEDAGKTQHAMASLQRSMAWDERAYNREYDLDVYHIVAVNDFNMGAMENKSLNIFNTKYVLARPEIATDQDYHAIEGVIGHEYFHNWSGNRVTCRDWFQLSLKEGFTVLRDQQFSGDMGSQGVQRINDVSLLRSVQFKEDAGPMAHPIRPDSYEEINNFYTVTVYEKGAEVVRMLHTLLGEKMFKRATDAYFEKFDGMAVTTDDFVDTLQSVSNINLNQFRLWYSQAGTPEVALETEYDADKKCLRLHFRQRTPATPEQATQAPFLIPIRIALFDKRGARTRFEFNQTELDEAVLHINDDQKTITLKNIPHPPVLSLLRGFSAPIKLHYTQDEATLAFLAQHDDDPFARWEAMQQFSLLQINLVMSAPSLKGSPARSGKQSNLALSAAYINLFEHILKDEITDPALLAQMLALPSESIVGQQMQTIEPDLIYAARKRIITELATHHAKLLRRRYAKAHAASSGKWTPDETGQRALRDACLSMLMRLESNECYALAIDQYKAAQCMTDTMAALSCLMHSHYPQKQGYLDDFHARWQSEDLLINKWLRLQSQDTDSQALSNIKKLTQHADFDKHNPNNVYSLIGGLLHANAVTFHACDGSGYDFAAQWILKLDVINPQVAARMVSCFNQWRRYNQQQQGLMQIQMEKIAAHDGLSKDVAEIINKALA